VQLPNPASAALPSQTPDPQLPVAGNSRFVGEPAQPHLQATSPASGQPMLSPCLRVICACHAQHTPSAPSTRGRHSCTAFPCALCRACGGTGFHNCVSSLSVRTVPWLQRSEIVNAFQTLGACAAAAETAITRDPVDIRIRAALSPIITPLISAVARRGITANVTAALVGPGTPLVRPLTLTQSSAFTSRHAQNPFHR
jgi:hypothetical protein